MNLYNVDWGKVFVPQVSPLEIFVRGTILYLALFLLLRVVLKRQVGTMSITNLLVIVLIADASQNAMTGGYNSLTDGIVLVGTLVFWTWFLDWLGFRFPALQCWLVAAPLPLVRDGRVLRRNLRAALMTDEELLSQLREQGVADLAEVKEARMEPDGRVSVIARDGRATRGPTEPRAGA